MSNLVFRDEADGTVGVVLDAQRVASYRAGDGRGVGGDVGRAGTSPLSRVHRRTCAASEWPRSCRRRCGCVTQRVRNGFSGDLRGVLTFCDAPDRDFLTELAVLVPDVAVTFAKQGRLRGLMSDMVSGLSGMARLVATPTDGTAPLVIALPERDELNAEVVGRAIDTTLAVHRRFGAASAHVRTLSFDHSSHGMADGKISGAAPHHRGIIHLNASLALADERQPQPPLPHPWTPDRRAPSRTSCGTRSRWRGTPRTTRFRWNSGAP